MPPFQSLVSIGLPVYNDERYLALALDSLLAQNYRDFELIISDNASTDGTPNICREYQSKDPRIRYYSNDTNLGAAWNFMRVFELASGEYFMWAGSHDLWHPTFIDKCKQVLDTEPETVLAYPRTQLIDGDGNPLQISPDRIDTRNLSRIKRTRIVVRDLSVVNMVHGLFRTSILRKCRMGFVCAGPDLVLLMEVGLYGAIAQVPELLFMRRNFREQVKYREHLRQQRLRLNPNAAKRKRNYPIIEMGFQYLVSTLHAQVPFIEKPYLVFEVMYHYFVRRNKFIWDELIHPIGFE